jgi:RNA polymerase sigma-70 factor (ECF subfamily)
VNSGLRRARAQLAQALPAEDELAEPAGPDQQALLARFTAAIENADGSALAELLAEDAVLEMPPQLTWFAGRDTVARFIASQLLTEPGRLRLVPVTANGQPGVAVYQREPDGAYRAHAVEVLTVASTGIARIVAFGDPGLFAQFGLPPVYSAGSAPCAVSATSAAPEANSRHNPERAAGQSRARVGPVPRPDAWPSATAIAE